MDSERVRQRFDALAQTYDDNPSRLAMTRALFEALTRAVPIEAHWTVLDYGAGTGLITLPVAALVKSMTAVDMSGEMLSVLADKAERQGLPVKTRQLDATGALTLEAPVELMISTMVLHHIRDLEGFLRQCTAWLKLGAYVALADLEPEDGTFHSDPLSVHHHGIDSDRLASSLERLGFMVDRVTRAHTIERTNDRGETATYPVFLLVTRWPGNG